MIRDISEAQYVQVGIEEFLNILTSLTQLQREEGQIAQAITEWNAITDLIDSNAFIPCCFKHNLREWVIEIYINLQFARARRRSID